MSNGYSNYEARVPPVYPPYPSPTNMEPRSAQENPAFVDYGDEGRPPRRVGGSPGAADPVRPSSNGASNATQPPTPPQRFVGLEPRDRKPWSGVPMDSSASSYANLGYTDSDQASVAASSISGQGAIMGNMPVISVMPDSNKKNNGSTDADFYAIRPVEPGSLYPELPTADNGFGGEGVDLVTNPPEVG